MFSTNTETGKKEFQEIIKNKRRQHGIIDIEDYYSKEQVLNIIKEDINIRALADLKDLPSNSVRDQVIYRMNKELWLTPKLIEKMTQLKAANIRKISRRYENSLNMGTCVPDGTNSSIGDSPQ